MSSEKIKEVALKYAVYNATTHDGKAQEGPVIGRIMGEFPELRENIDEVVNVVETVVEEVNSWSPEDQVKTLEKEWPELATFKKEEIEKKTLPPLKNIERFKEIRTRFAPNPDGALHLGSAEPVIFCDEYAKMYDGKFILRYEDTSPDVKAPILEIYEWIMNDLEWLSVKVDEVYYQSERLELYYNYAEKLLKMGAAYVCTCEPSIFKELYMANEACPCRQTSPDPNVERWKKMLDGSFQKGEAVVRIKTDLNHPNPAVRDWPALRVATGAHPRTGRKYRVWPLYNFSCAIDDHEMSVSHIIRGKEHEVNTIRQKQLVHHLGWEYPEIINIGRLGLEVGVLSKSRIRAGIESGLYISWDDPRLGTLMALKRRGLQPETVRDLMIQIGPKPINATLSWAHISSVNRKNIEYRANRYFFVKDPIELRVKGISREYNANLPLHPDDLGRGTRNYVVKPFDGQANLLMSASDAENLRTKNVMRLMGLFNIEIIEVAEKKVIGKFHSKDHKIARELSIPFVHWIKDVGGIETKVVMPDASVVTGLSESMCRDLKIDDMIQFERFGFVRVDRMIPFVAYYAHR